MIRVASIIFVVTIILLSSCRVQSSDAKLLVRLGLDDTPFSYRCKFENGHATEVVVTEDSTKLSFADLKIDCVLQGNEHKLLTLLEKACEQMKAVGGSRESPWCVAAVELTADGLTKQYELTGHFEYLRAAMLELKLLRDVHSSLLRGGRRSKHSAWAFMDLNQCVESSNYIVDLPVNARVLGEEDSAREDQAVPAVPGEHENAVFCGSWDC